MPSMIDDSIARAINLLNDLVQTQRQEIDGLKDQIKDMRIYIRNIEHRERYLVDELEHYKMLVTNLEANQK